MATNTKKDHSEYSVEEKLQSLYQLQTMLTEIDKIKTLRGELPLEVQDLEDEIAGLTTRIDKANADIVEMNKGVAENKNAIEVSRNQIAKYQEQGKSANDRFYSQPMLFRWGVYIAAIVGIILFGTYGFGFDAQDFIYGGF
jgi:predicted  nucleic acid-binding Zn-ribbon protein